MKIILKDGTVYTADRISIDYTGQELEFEEGDIPHMIDTARVEEIYGDQTYDNPQSQSR